MIFDRIKNNLIKLQDLNFLLIVYVGLTIIATAHLLLEHNYIIAGREYVHYNNYILFKQSFIHLITNNNLYDVVTNRFNHVDYQYWDYKYSPTFAVYMIFFAYLPNWLGLILFNLLNTFVLFYGIKMLPGISNKIKAFIIWFILLDNVTSIQNSQTNALIAGLLLFSFIFMEQRKVFIATLCIVLSIYIKPFGILGFLLFLFYPGKIKFILYSALWTITLFAIPLIFVSFRQFIYLYKSWIHILQFDHDTNYGLSVMGWLYVWFKLNIQKNLVLAAGALIFLIPFIKYKMYKSYYFRLLIVCSILIWVIIFNHKAESSTFIIADCGMAIWYFSKPRKIGDTILIISAFILTILSPTSLFPDYLKTNLVIPYVLKVVPCIFIWVKINYELLSFKESDDIGVHTMTNS